MRLLAAFLLCSAALAGCGGEPATSGSTGPAPSTDVRFRAAAPADSREVLAVVREYIDGLNASDGKRVCPLVLEETRGGMEIDDFGGCEELIAAFTSYVEDAGNGGWDRAEVLEEGPVTVAGDRARVRLRVRHHHLENGANDFTGIETINLLRRDGRWWVGRPRDLFGAQFPAAGSGRDADDPVGAPELIVRPVAEQLPAFRCRTTAEVGDPADDVMWERPVQSFDDESEPELVDAPWVDVRTVRFGTADGRICAVVTLSDRPRPASGLLFSIDQPTGRPDGGFRPVTAGVRIDGLGAGHPEPVIEEAIDLSASRRKRVATDFGWRGRELHLLFGRVLEIKPLRWSLTMTSNQPDEPLLDEPVGGEDGVGEESSAEFDPRR